jgi:hypothetical protein
MHHFEAPGRRERNVKQALLAACAVVAIGVSGCEERRSELMINLDKAVQDSQKRVEDAQRKLDEANKAASKEAQACILSFPALRIGDDEAKVRSLMPCKPDHVNTTETAKVYHEQWVFETSSGVPSLGIGPSFMFLYFDNGKLVAKQI